MSDQQPAFTAYTVTKREGQEDWWCPIGAAFSHQDGGGYNLVLQALPVNGKIVLRVPKERDSTPSAGVERAQQAIRQENNRRRGR